MLHSLMFYLYSNLPLSWGFKSYLACFACPDNEPLHFHHDGCPVCDGYTADQMADIYNDIMFGKESPRFTNVCTSDCYLGLCDCVDE